MCFIAFRGSTYNSVPSGNFTYITANQVCCALSSTHFLIFESVLVDGLKISVSREKCVGCSMAVRLRAGTCFCCFARNYQRRERVGDDHQRIGSVVLWFCGSVVLCGGVWCVVCVVVCIGVKPVVLSVPNVPILTSPSEQTAVPSVQ
jgi:hypothetical protein